MSAVSSARQKLDDLDPVLGERGRREEHERVEDEDEQEAEHERERQPQGRDDRREECVEDGDDERP